MKLEFSWQIFEKYPISNFMKIFPVVAKFHADKSHESDSCFFFCNFVNTLQNPGFSRAEEVL